MRGRALFTNVYHWSAEPRARSPRPPHCSHGPIVADHRRLRWDDGPDDVNWVTWAAEGSIGPLNDMTLTAKASRTVPTMTSTMPRCWRVTSRLYDQRRLRVRPAARRRQENHPAHRIFSLSLTASRRVCFITERVTGSRRTSRIERIRRWTRSQGCCQAELLVTVLGHHHRKPSVGANLLGQFSQLRAIFFRHHTTVDKKNCTVTFSRRQHSLPEASDGRVPRMAFMFPPLRDRRLRLGALRDVRVRGRDRL